MLQIERERLEAERQSREEIRRLEQERYDLEQERLDLEKEKMAQEKRERAENNLSYRNGNNFINEPRYFWNYKNTTLRISCWMDGNKAHVRVENLRNRKTNVSGTWYIDSWNENGRYRFRLESKQDVVFHGKGYIDFKVHVGYRGGSCNAN